MLKCPVHEYSVVVRKASRRRVVNQRFLQNELKLMGPAVNDGHDADYRGSIFTRYNLLTVKEFGFFVIVKGNSHFGVEQYFLRAASKLSARGCPWP